MNLISHTRFASLTHTNSLRTLFLLAALLLSAGTAISQTTSFTYQGRLNDGNSAANGSYDFQFKLFDAATSGNQIGTTNALNGVVVASGGFTVPLDFGAGAFPGADRWLEVSVKPPNSNTFILLTSRHRVTATPYAIKSLSAATADGLSVTCIDCVTDAQIGGVAASKLTGELPAARVPDLGGSYIKNSTAIQGLSNFNISGNGAVGGTFTSGALRQELTASAPNIINGFLGTGSSGTAPGNSVTAGVIGASIGGGGYNGALSPFLNGNFTNRVTDWFGTIGGGLGNRAGDDVGVLDSASYATVSGGHLNTASGAGSAVSGGLNNVASGFGSIVSGGGRNTASSNGSTVSGGLSNVASGVNSIVSGGEFNLASGDKSFAAGTLAGAIHRGAFVWGDSTLLGFASTAPNQFLIRASGGVGIGLNNPSSPLTVNGVIESKAGGIKFPDGTTQVTAVTGGNFIQNSRLLQPNSNFNISGNGTVGGAFTSGALRQEVTASAPNIINGFLGTGNGGATPGNLVTAGVVGASIGGGGYNGRLTYLIGDLVNGNYSNRVTDWFGTVGGGLGNSAGGGDFNRPPGFTANATVSGGFQNTASGNASSVSGGFRNTASGNYSIVSGGNQNTASGNYSIVSGGFRNTASGGGSFAAGTQAKANHAGAFVWADSSGFNELIDQDFISTGADQFLIRASGGVGIGLNNPSSPLTVNGVIESKAGGIKFPDGTTQVTAVTGGNFIQNSTALQANSNFNISGNGTLLGKLTAGNGFNGRCTSVFIGTGVCDQDIAETFATLQKTNPGDVVALIPRDHNKPAVRKALRAYDDHLVGVVSTSPGLVFDEGETHLSGGDAKPDFITKDKTVVAVVGRVPVRFTLENGLIQVGDPLTSSVTVPGAAMKATEAGKIIGYALESSDKASKENENVQTNAKLLMWLQVGHYVPPASLARLRASGANGKNVAAMQKQIEQQVQAQVKARTEHLERQIEELKSQNNARLAALEQMLQQLSQQLIQHAEKQPKQ